jgi:hypothetical protein
VVLVALAHRVLVALVALEEQEHLLQLHLELQEMWVQLQEAVVVVLHLLKLDVKLILLKAEAAAAVVHI